MIADVVLDFFRQFGPFAILFGLFLIFVLDSSIAPVFPEIFVLVLFMARPSLPWAAGLLGMALVGEVAGNTILFLLVDRTKTPEFIQKIIRKYITFLVVEDEKIILVNRFAPVIPFMGAFIATCNWDYRKAMAYTVISGFIYYLILLTFSGLFYTYLTNDVASKVTWGLVGAVILVSFVSSTIQRKRKEASIPSR